MVADGHDGPLAGLRLVNTSNNLIGAHVGQLLADFGAEVVLVEPPGGSPLREQAAWPAWSRGSRSVELDLHDPADARTAVELAADADVFLETWRPGVAERLGLGFDELGARNPRLVYASVTGFGRTGPLSRLKAYEGVVMAKVGGYGQFSVLTDRPGPSFPSVQYCSVSAAQTVLQGVFAALIERTRSGLGQRVDATMLQAVAAHDVFNWMTRLIAARYPDAFRAVPVVDPATAIPNSWMSYALLVALTKDGRWLQFSQATPKLYHAFLEAIGADGDEWDQAWHDDDIQRRGAFRQKALEAVRSRTLAEWQDYFDEHPDVFAEVFRRDRELLDHPQLLHDHQIAEAPQPGHGVVRAPASLVTLFGTPGRADRPVPALDEHGDGYRAEPSRVTAAATPTGDTPSMPLEGITILELGTFFAGPYGASILTDYGARVIKIEQHDGDPIRYQLPMPEAGAVKAILGKESIAIDINTPDGQELVRQIAKQTDIVLCTFRGGVVERMGLDEAALRKVNPDIVYHHGPGFGIDGPYAHRPAYAPTIGAGAGMARRNIGDAVPEGPDLSWDEIKRGANRLGAANLTMGHADGFSALGVATALALGLLVRALGGPGQRSRTTMLSTMSHVLDDDLVEWDGRPAVPRPDDGLHGIGACYRLYEAADGWVFLAVTTDREWDALVAELGDRSLSRADDDALAERLAGIFRARPAAEWEKVMTDADVACVEVDAGPSHATIMDPGGLAEQLGMMTTVVHPVLDEHTRLTSLVRFSRSATRAGPAPAIGEHTDALLRELGLGEDRIAELRAAGVVL